MNKQTEKKILEFDVNDPEQFQQLVEHLRDDMLKGKSVKESLDLPENDLEIIYSVAYQKYNFGEYRNAADIFTYLMLLDPQCYKYILGLAASMQRLGEYQQAANHYFLASLHEPGNPIPYFHGAECLMRSNQNYMASKALQLAIEFSGDKAEFSELKERAKLINKTLEKELNQEPNEMESE